MSGARLPVPAAWSTQSQSGTPSRSRVSSRPRDIKRRVRRTSAQAEEARGEQRAGARGSGCVSPPENRRPRPGFGKFAREGDTQLLEKPEGMASAVERVRPEVERGTFSDVRRRPAAEVSRLLEDDDGSARPRDEGRGRQPGQAAPDDDQVRVAVGMFPTIDHGLLLCGEWIANLRDRPRPRFVTAGPGFSAEVDGGSSLKKSVPSRRPLTLALSWTLRERARVKVARVGYQVFVGKNVF